MNGRSFSTLVGILCCLLGIGGALALAQGTAGINWSTLGSGGGALTGSSRIAVNGTLGQPVTGFSSAEGVSLDAGFWYGTGVTYRIHLPLVLRSS